MTLDPGDSLVPLKLSQFSNQHNDTQHAGLFVTLSIARLCRYAECRV
jgi:hypothetical protein